MQLFLKIAYTKAGMHVCGSVLVFRPAISAGSGPLECAFWKALRQLR